MSNAQSVNQEILETVRWVFFHHDSERECKVVGRKPDVFVVGGDGHGYDVAVRIDGGYTDRSAAEDVAANYWRLQVERLTKALRDSHSSWLWD